MPREESGRINALIRRIRTLKGKRRMNHDETDPRSHHPSALSVRAGLSWVTVATLAVAAGVAAAVPAFMARAGSELAAMPTSTLVAATAGSRYERPVGDTSVPDAEVVFYSSNEEASDVPATF
jgi:hypothetical protein